MVLIKLELSKFNAILVALGFWFLWDWWLSMFFVTSQYLSSTSFDFYNSYVAGSSLFTHTNPYLSGKFVYPPASLPFLALFALTDHFTAAQLWMALSFSVFAAASLALISTLKRERRLLFVSVLAILFFTSFPLMMVIENGQDELLVSSLVILGLVSQRLKHQSVSAVLLSVATLLKGPAVLLLIYFVVFRRDLKYLLDYVLAIVVFIGASLPAVPTDWYWYYFTKVVPTLPPAANLDINQSIVRYLALFGMTRFSPAVSFAGGCLFAAFTYFLGPGKRMKIFRTESLPSDAVFLMNILLMLLLGSRAWEQDYVWVLLPVVLIVSALRLERVRFLYLALVGVAAFLMNTRPRGYTGWFLYQYHVSMVIPTLLIGNLIMVVCLIPILVRSSLVINSRHT